MMNKKVDLILENETYQLRGILFEVHNKLGSVQKEAAYGNAIAIIFKRLGIPYQKEAEVTLKFEDEEIGKLYLDFVVWDKIALELKAKKFLTQEDFRQALRYTEALNLPLILLVNFRSQKLVIKRIINAKYQRYPR